MFSQQTIYYDLTEVLQSATAKRIQYYGIARVVIEVGREIARQSHQVRFVVFSFGLDCFFEVKYSDNEQGEIEFNIPNDVGQKWQRTFFGKSIVRSTLGRSIRALLKKRNIQRWVDRASSLEKIRIEGGCFVSAGRPKLLVDMVKALEKAGSKTKLVPFLHDFMPLHNGMTKRLSRFDRNFLRDNQFLLGRSSLILTNSRFTEQELSYFVKQKLLSHTCAVQAVPLVHECVQGEEEALQALPTQPYLLTVGLNLGRKNIELLLESLRQMQAAGQTIPNLVIAGANRKRLRRYIERDDFNDIREQIHYAINPNQTELVRLYENALALVIPSRIEGWGLPAGEALWCGVPAVCSTAPVLKEVCGELGLYFDPDSPKELIAIIEKLHSDSDFRPKLVARIKQSKDTLRRWNSVAADTLKALEKL